MYVTASLGPAGINEDSKGKVKGDKLAFFPLPAKDGGEARPVLPGGNDIAVWGGRQGDGRGQAST